MDTGTDGMNRRVGHLCSRHRVALRWASLRDRLPSELAESSPRYRVEVLDRARLCADCRARNDRGWSPSRGASDRRSEPRRSVHVGWVIVVVSMLAVAVGLAGLGLMSRTGVPAGDTGPAAGKTADRPVEAASPQSTGRFVDYPDLKPGDCVRDMESEDVDLEVVPCATPHSDEVVGTFTLPRQKWPGQERADRLAERGCRPRFEKYVGVPVNDSTLDWFSDAPIKFGWPEDRSVVCTAADTSGASTGSVRGTGR